ncbi:hypothetical protein M5K25_003806 [Dendrobium thyrsiflorum]|uniref:Uncharacterized protein n=1 Tax=Dendrobium thyrsiflorum TaxID=117978 RepID=A0ABD0VL45_DENTH
MVRRRGRQSSPCSGGCSGRLASKHGNYWKVFEGMETESCDQVLLDVHAARLGDILSGDGTTEEHEQLVSSLDDAHLHNSFLGSAHFSMGIDQMRGVDDQIVSQDFRLDSSSVRESCEYISDCKVQLSDKHALCDFKNSSVSQFYDHESDCNPQVQTKRSFL